MLDFVVGGALAPSRLKPAFERRLAARAALSIAEHSGNATRIGDARYRLSQAEPVHREALRRWDERERRQAEARRKARERRDREERGR